MNQFESQLGQDKYLFENFLKHKNGFFVDVGAHDGVFLSNTFFFENELNWSGVCVEPSKQSQFLIKNRPNSKVFNCCACPLEFNNQIVRHREFTNMEISHTIFEDLYEPPHYAKELEAEDGGYWDRLKKCKTLDVILEESDCKKNIDYVSIDTQGCEWLILKDFPLKKWNVKAFTVANDMYQGGKNLENRNKTKKYLEKNKYKLLKSFSLKELDKNNWGKNFEEEIIEDLYIKQGN